MHHSIAVAILPIVLATGCLPASDDAPAEDFAVVSVADRMGSAELWPGFDPRAIPVAIYDGQRTLLFRHPSPPAGFQPLPGRTDVLVYPGRHPGVTANSSADINGVSTATLMPPTDSATMQSRAGILIHEAFHVFQRANHPAWVANEAEAFTYPMADPVLLGLARMESEALRRALVASDDDRAACWSRAALAIRGQRFGRMSEGASAYERGIEMTEGLASYVESRAVGRPDSIIMPAGGFAAGEFRQRGYATGTALARLLDRLAPAWRASLAEDDSTSLDALLSAVLTADGGGRTTCEFTATEADRMDAAAAADVDALRAELARRRSDFLAQPGWRLVVVAAGSSLFPQGFDPLNVRIVAPGEVLHGRWLKLGNDGGVMEVLGRPALSRAAGAHPLFDGVRELTIAGLPDEPTVTATDGAVIVKADGVDAELRGATVERSGQTVTIRLPLVR